MLRCVIIIEISIYILQGLLYSSDQFKIVGYLPDYRIEAIDISVAEHVTDLIFFSLEPTADGRLDDSRFNDNVLFKLGQIKDAYDIRIHVALGGWERSSGFAAMATNDSLRANFIQELLDFCLSYEFDGVDYDWEFPQNVSENNAYTALIVETKEAFQPFGLIVTTALNVYQNLKVEAYAALDHIHVMSYDYAGQHATYNQAVSDISNFLGRGIAPEKIYLGVPFYGRHISDRTAYSYSYIIDTYNPEPEVDQVADIYFNGIETIKKKTQFAINKGIGGIMIWEVGQDTRDDTSLLLAIYETFISKIKITDFEKNYPEKFTLYQNFPNPFNSSTVISWHVGATGRSPVQIELSIYNVLGQKVVTLISEKQPAGYYEYTFDASTYASGLYYYVLHTEQGMQSRRMLFIK